MEGQQRREGLPVPASPVRVLVANLPGLIADLVASLIRQEDDMQLVGPVQGQLEVLTAARDVDVIILGARATVPLPAVCSHLLQEYPDLRIVVMPPAGAPSMLYWRGLRQEPVDTDSVTAVATTIRRSYRLNPTI